MTNHYDTLGVERDATLGEIKRAFREKAKQLHPDISGEPDSAMRRLIDAYTVLSDMRQRFQYDKTTPIRPRAKKDFDFRAFLKERSSEPQYKARLIFFDLFNFAEAEAVSLWRAAGGLAFPLESLLDREDWMDSGFVLAEELEKHNFVYESFVLLTRLLKEERKQPYFKHFGEDVELLLKEIARQKLRRAVSEEVWISSLRSLLELGFPAKDEARWLKNIAQALLRTGDSDGAASAFFEARLRDSAISIPKKLQNTEYAG
ncbi:MAG: J domain-containing protein [Spirochaetaceae bacterium]|jgi:curved DNA-binding protein CbpA|nr:J domain-containing protein [Spirochaetaceae bacterium]